MSSRFNVSKALPPTARERFQDLIEILNTYTSLTEASLGNYLKDFFKDEYEIKTIHNIPDNRAVRKIAREQFKKLRPYKE